MDKKRAVVFFLLLIPLLLSGCVKFHIDQIINPDGSSDITFTYDLSGLVETFGALGGLGEGDGLEVTDPSQELRENLTQSCADITAKHQEGQIPWANFHCTATDDLTLTMGGTIPAEAVTRLEIDSSFMATTYKYNIQGMHDLLKTLEDSQESDLKFGDDQASEAFTKGLGFEFTYTLEMPGEINEVEGGVVEDNKVTFDLLELEKNPNIEIVASQRNDMLLYALVGGLSVIVLIVLVVVILHLKKSPPSVPTPINPQITQFIQSCRSRSIKDAEIKKQLLKAGWPSKEVEMGLKK